MLFLVLGGVLFLKVVAQYGAEAYRIATEPVLAGSSFFVHETPNNITCLYDFYPHLDISIR